MKKYIRIEIVSFVHGLPNKQRLVLTRDIINQSVADLMLFSGHTIGSVKDIEILKEEVQNNKTNVILELQDIKSEKISNCLYKLSAGRLESMYTNQLFTTSREIENNNQLAERLLNELKTRRKIKVKGLKVLIIQCGELNILKNLQAKKNRVEYRVTKNKELVDSYDDLFQQTDLFLNPIHTPMGNQGKMAVRRTFLSNNNRYYFSSSNTKADSANLKLKSLQFACYNGEALVEVNKEIREKVVLQTFEIGR